MRSISLIVVALLLGLLLAGCGTNTKIVEVVVTATPGHAPSTKAPATSTSAPVPTNTPEPIPTMEPATPTPEPVETVQCAAGITAEVRDIDSRVDWAAYCPTFLPENFAKELIGGPNPLEIRTVNPATGARIYFVQGTGMGLSSVTSLVRNEGELVGPVMYGDLPANLYHSLPGAEHGPFVAVLALPEGESGVIQYIEAYDVSEDDIRAVAESMVRVNTLP